MRKYATIPTVEVEALMKEAFSELAYRKQVRAEQVQSLAQESLDNAWRYLSYAQADRLIPMVGDGRQDWHHNMVKSVRYMQNARGLILRYRELKAEYWAFVDKGL